MEVNETTSTKSKRKQSEAKLMEELRKQGIDPNIINEYGDIDFEDGIDDYIYISRVNDNYSEYGDDDY